jgi:hypothetical protein
MTVCLGNVRTCLGNARGWLPNTSSLLSVAFWYIRCCGPRVPPGPSSAGQWVPNIAGDAAASEPPSGGETKLGAARHVAVPEPSRVGSRLLSGWAHGCTGALPSGETFVAARDMVTPEPSRALERGMSYPTRGSSRALSSPGWILEPWDMWRCVAARLVFGPGLEHVCGGTRSVGYRQCPPGPP